MAVPQEMAVTHPGRAHLGSPICASRGGIGPRGAPLASATGAGANWLIPSITRWHAAAKAIWKSGKNVYYTVHHLCHMVLALKPFGCMPSSQSDGVQSTVISRFPEMIFLPIETAGEGEINAHSRVQMALGEAKAKAKAEFDRCLESTGQRLEDIRDYVAEHAELRSPLYRVPRRPDVAGVAANFVLHVSDLMSGKTHSVRRQGAQTGMSNNRQRLPGRCWMSVPPR